MSRRPISSAASCPPISCPPSPDILLLNFIEQRSQGWASRGLDISFSMGYFNKVSIIVDSLIVISLISLKFA